MYSKEGAEGSEVDALEFFTAIYYEILGKTPITANAPADDHQATAVTRRIESHIYGGKKSGIRATHKGYPRPAQNSAGDGAPKCNVQLRMIYVANLKRQIALTWCIFLKPVAKWRNSVSSLMSSSLSHLGMLRSLLRHLYEGCKAGRNESFGLAILR
jgi:predicted alpha/beta hydrolase